MNQKNKKILYIWDADYPWDVRVEKICTTLMKNGNEVHIAARNLKKLPQYEEIDGLHIHRLNSFKNNRINYALSFPFFFNPIWKYHLNRIIKQYGLQLIIVRDLPMAIAGIWTGKRNNIPVILDMAEDYVSMIRDIWRARKYQGLNLIVRNPYLARVVERYVLWNSDHILVVVEEAIDVVRKGGGSIDKATIVGNTPSIQSFNNSEIQLNDDLKKIKERFSVIYTGGIQMGRGIQTVFEAIPEITKELPDFLFVVVGDGYATGHFKKLINERGLQNNVLWVGWVDHEKIFDYIRLSKVGLIPHLVSDHVNTTIPNKIFDYMAAGLPVIASNAEPMKRILQEEGCGITFTSGDYEDLVRAFYQITKDGSNYGKKGREAICNKYNWEEDEKRLLKAIKIFN